jgi:uncharacterized protein YndB with AHSA1/START domain
VTAMDGSGEVLVVRRIIPAPREQVFDAWLDPKSLARWMRPKGTTGVKAEVDPRVGGQFRIVMLQGQESYEHTGEYLVIEPPARLSFTWISRATNLEPTVVTIEFLERDGNTELVLTHRRLPPTQIDSHRSGWSDIAEALRDQLTGSSSGQPSSNPRNPRPA